MKTLIVYGTRYGATTDTAEKIAKDLREEGFEVQLADLKKEKIKDISPFDLIIVGSGMQITKWVGEVEDFIKKFKGTLSQKKLAIFVSSGKATLEREGKTEEIAKLYKQNLQDKVDKYNLHPITTAMFGGIMNFNKMNLFFRKTMSGQKKVLEDAGFKEEPAGVFDMRNMDEIHAWAKELAQKAR
jgi:menaquinone-dependent protoporphyrinogen oxidase